jgi:alkylation response protein AidB-like acyl-CoA dehydrogenase
MATISSAGVPAIDEIATAAPDVDRSGRFPSEALDVLRRDGLLSLGVPPERGGPGGGPREAVDAIEQVAGACASAAIVYLMHLVGTQTLLAGTPPDDPDAPRDRPRRAPHDAGLLRARLARALLGAGVTGTRRG